MFGFRTKRKNKLKAEIINDIIQHEALKNVIIENLVEHNSLKQIINSMDIYVDNRMKKILNDQDQTFITRVRQLKMEMVKAFAEMDDARSKDNQDIMKLISRVEKNIYDEIRIDRLKRDRRETTNQKGREY